MKELRVHRGICGPSKEHDSPPPPATVVVDFYFFKKIKSKALCNQCSNVYSLQSEGILLRVRATCIYAKFSASKDSVHLAEELEMFLCAAFPHEEV